MRNGRNFDWRYKRIRAYRACVGSQRAAKEGSPMPSPATLPNAALVDHIVERHHAYARRALPYIVPLLSKVTGVHRGQNRKLAALCDAGHELADALEAHLDAEEREIFPALLAGAPVLRREIAQVDLLHRQLDLLLARIRWLADDYDAPEWAGRSYRVLLEELAALEEDVREHLHLERNVVIPRLSSRCQEAA
jgi:regulator of cell morphogenesis and NO signaling